MESPLHHLLLNPERPSALSHREYSRAEGGQHSPPHPPQSFHRRWLCQPGLYVSRYNSWSSLAPRTEFQHLLPLWLPALTTAVRLHVCNALGRCHFHPEGGKTQSASCMAEPPVSQQSPPLASTPRPQGCPLSCAQGGGDLLPQDPVEVVSIKAILLWGAGRLLCKKAEVPNRKWKQLSHSWHGVCFIILSKHVAIPKSKKKRQTELDWLKEFPHHCYSSDASQKGSEASLSSKIQVLIHTSKIPAFWDRLFCLS